MAEEENVQRKLTEKKNRKQKISYAHFARNKEKALAYVSVRITERLPYLTSVVTAAA